MTKGDAVPSSNSGTSTSSDPAPSITSQPSSQTITSGQTATFSVAASGTAPLTYQWQLNGSPIGGATAASYTTPAESTSSSGANFSVVVSNSVNSATSGTATLTVNAAPVAPSITTQPSSQTITSGQTATFSVAASGTAPLTYQWQLNGSPISGATSASYTTPVEATSNSGAQFSVVVSNSVSSATSGSATLTVNAAPVAPSITTQPTNQTITSGQTATFSVAASGTAPLTYQWQLNGSPIGGATSASYTTPVEATSDSGAQFSVVVSNLVSSATSGIATLTVNAAPVAPSITTQPSSQTISSGQTATFSVAASGTAPLTYQWQLNGSPIGGATAASYTTPTESTSSSGANFSVVVSNSVSSATSGSATLTVNAAPVAPSITTQPSNQTISSGQTATFSVVASGTAPLTYQWQLNGSPIGGAIAASYTTPTEATSSSGAQFSVVVSNSVSSATSGSATLTVNAAPVAPSITTQPTNQTITSGQTATFSVAASGTAPLAYQWQLNGSPISGATSASYTTPVETTSNSGAQFAVVVSNSVSSATSGSAALTVNAAPVAPSITTQPSSQTISSGQTATFSVAASGTAPLTYQWQLNGSPIGGATAASYTTPTESTSSSGANFSVVVSNSVSSATSGTATLTVNAAPVAPSITTQPTNQTITSGQTATFSVAASGTAPLTYQWQLNGSPIGGATAASYTTPAESTSSSGANFSVVVSNSVSSATSGSATLTVNAAPVAPSITTQPSSQTITSGQTATFSVAASGTAPLTYQWQLNGSPIGGATSASYTTPVEATSNSGAQFSVVVSNSVSSATSGIATLTVNAAPVAPSITTQPTNQTITSGQTATFSVAASGTAPLTYHWQLNGSPIGGATSASYTTPTEATSSSGAQFSVVVSNSVGNVTSANAVLTVNAAPVAPSITTQPTNQTITSGQTATFSVAASGTAPLTYQWQLNGSPIGGATSASYTTPVEATSNSGAQFSVVVSNSVGNATSANATLTVNAAPVAPSITTQPSNQTITSGQTATFSVAASGTAPLTYQWQLNGSPIGGATATSYTTPAESTSSSGANFSVVVSNSVSSATSTGATLTVNAAPVAPSITTQPSSQTITSGQTATFSVAASGTAPLTYQWQLNGSPIGGATSASYTTPVEATSDSGAQFSVVVSNLVSSATSGIATLTVNAAPVAPSITTQPSNQTITSGQTATFSVAASGTAPLTYQWQLNGSPIGGATSASYTTPVEATSNNGAQFSVVVSNSVSSATSGSATLTVNAAPVAPSITPVTGTYGSPLSVTITPAVAGTPIYYTTNNTTPTTSSTLYTGPFSLNNSATVEAIAVASGSASNVASTTYTLQGQTTVPVIFNFSSNAQPGDIISIQGTNFGTNPQVWLAGAGGSTATQLTVVNQVGTQWIAAQTPPTWTGAMVLWVSNSSGASNSVNLNGAVPLNLDALELVPGGAFRVLGRNLLMAGYTPIVTINGQAATINIAASNVNMLVATAPGSISSSSSAVITIDNGNGTGPVQLNRPITVVGGSGDPFGLGVGWAAGFTFSGRTIAVNTPCNGSQDDSANIQSAINSAANGGGVVQLPSGTCVLARSLTMQSDVVLQGVGQNSTILEYDSDYPISAQSADLVGLRNFTLVNADSTVEGLIWKQNTRSFFQNITVESGLSHQLFLTGNQNFIVTQSSFIQGGSVGEQNPYLFSNCSGFVFSNNTSVSVDGSPTFQSIHDTLIVNNHFTRNAVNQYEAVTIATHQFVMDFAYRTEIIGNTFDVTNGPITNTSRNDGETLLTEGGGGNRTENYGTVGSATPNTITDTNNVINVNPFGTGLPENYGVAIVGGTGAGQTREVTGYSNSTLQVDHAWDVVPDTTSRYATFVWGLEKTLIEGNSLIGNPRGIWLYQAATRDVDIANNTITNGGGIFLRSEEQVFNGSVKQFDPMYGVRIEGNNISNSNGIWMSYLNVLFVNADHANFGTADTGVEIRNNTLTANNPNVTSTTEDRNTKEGFMNLMVSEASGGVLTNTPMILGTIFQTDRCPNCSVAFVIGTGDYGTVLSGSQPPVDWQTLGSLNPGSIWTVVQ